MLSPLVIQFDYSLDANYFFDTQAKKDLLQQAGNALAARLTDNGLSAIQPGGGNSWTATFTNPATGQPMQLNNLVVPAGTLIVYVGGRVLNGAELGEGGPGGGSASGPQSWLYTVIDRGKDGAFANPPTQFGPWGGNLAFATNASWYFGASVAGLPSNQADFLTVATHELGHLLGIGTAGAWGAKVSGTVFAGYQFTGANATAANGGAAVPVISQGSHWADGTTSGGQEAAMTPHTLIGTRKLFTNLDFAGLADIGWTLTTPIDAAPVLTLPTSGTFNFSQGGTPIGIAPGATVTDADSLDFDTGTLTGTLTAGGDVNDRLEIRNQGTAAGQIGVAGGNVTFGGTVIGTMTGGTGLTPLVVTFNASADAAVAQALVRNVVFETVGSNPATAARTVRFQVTDGDGGASSAATRTVTVVSLKGSANEVRMYRAYNPNADYHFFTTAFPEFANAVNAGYHDETSGRPGFDVLDDLTAGGTAVHRMYNPNNGRHYYTVSDGEREFLVSVGWRYEKDEGFMFTSQASGRAEIFRLYNKNSGVHLYTENPGVKDAILAQFAGTWFQHSSLGFAFAVGADGSSAAAVAAAIQPLGSQASSGTGVVQTTNPTVANGITGTAPPVLTGIAIVTPLPPRSNEGTGTLPPDDDTGSDDAIATAGDEPPNDSTTPSLLDEVFLTADAGLLLS